MNFEGSQSYTDYHKKTNQAEKLIIDREFREALNVYQSLFDSYEFVFLREYKIATQLALILNNNERAIEFIRLGVTSGWDLNSIKKDKNLSQLKNYSGWELMEKDYNGLRKTYLERLDEHTKTRVHQMYKKDQRKALGAILRIGLKTKEKYALEKFAPHSEGQIQELIEIIKTQGYPGEKLIGNNYWVSTIISHHNSITTEYVKQDTLYGFIRPKLIKAIENGQMSPYEFALIDDWRIAVESERTQLGLWLP